MLATRVRPHRSGRWLVPFVVTFALAALWALASPQFSGPDEPAQVLRSVSLVRGTLLGHPVGGPQSPTTKVSVPAWLAGANAAPGCFAGRTAVSARCEPPLPGAAGSVVVATYAGRYPPLYYALVGWPSLIFSGDLALYLMRLASAAASAIFLAGAMYCASCSRHARGLVPGLALVITPQAFFLAGVINPSGLEISAAICVWTSALVCCEGGDATTEPSLRGRPVGAPDQLGGPPGAVLGWLCAASLVMVNIRGLSPFLLVVIYLALGAYAGRRRLRALLGDRRVRICAAAVLAVTALAVVWVVAAGALRVRPSGTQLPSSAGPWLTLGLTLENLGPETLQMVGVFGWVDTYLPAVCYVVWLGLTAAFVGRGIGSRLSHRRTALLGFAFATLAVPAILLLTRSNSLGIFGQARDWMPLWVGLPLLVGHSLSTSPGTGGRGRSRGALIQRWFRGAYLVLLPALQIVAWSWALRRYRTGSGHVALTSAAAWSPPLPATALLLGVCACAALLGWEYWRTAHRVTDDGRRG